MHRIDAADHLLNQFQDGNPGTGTLGTKLDAAWANAVQENLCGFIEAAGIALVKGDHTQLTDAVNAFFAALKAAQNTWGDRQTMSKGLTATGEDAVNKEAVRATGVGNRAAIYGVGSNAGDAADGVYGEGASRVGVRGATNSDTIAAVVGSNGQLGPGVLGASSGGVGVRAETSPVAPTRGALQVAPQVAPSGPQDGDMWVETGTNTLKVRINGVTKTVTLT